MNRRRFLRQSSLLTSGSLLLPVWLAACKKKSLFEENTFKGKVGIIGAGVSGMYAALLLKKHGADVSIFEASDRWGGRIRTLEGFSDFPVELGAEEIHGEHSAFFDLIRASGEPLITDELQDIYFVDGQVMSESDLEGESDYIHLSELVDSLWQYDGADVNAASFATLEGVSERLRHVFNAWVPNENGTSAERIGMRGVQEGDAAWTAGDINHMLRGGSMSDLLADAFSDVLPLVQYNTPIVQVSYGGSQVRLLTSDGTEHTFDKVIVTASVKVLFDDMISFVPQLPALHLQAINSIGMGAGMKVILKFTERFWPANTGSIYSPGLVPEFWATGAGGRSAEDRLLTAFVHGQNAEDLLALGDGMIPQILSELDLIFEGQATEKFEDHVTMNWGDEPWIRGTYSYPKPGNENQRGLLATPIADKLYFAGEATHEAGHHGTVHGAMESAFRTVKSMLITSE